MQLEAARLFHIGNQGMVPQAFSSGGGQVDAHALEGVVVEVSRPGPDDLFELPCRPVGQDIRLKPNNVAPAIRRGRGSGRGGGKGGR
ncbi:protein kinase [Thiohalobacter thiocyanaticus]|uniref:Protein kinase n=1 Tax=Thiohalobacter thiocyanaticus TaxID=585455 RepID=A0A1Z4VSI7_9GAMM|nr:protein kinase [Thiohalobacter thiocyanaticus]